MNYQRDQLKSLLLPKYNNRLYYCSHNVNAER